RTGAQGPPPPDAAGGRGQDEGGDGDAPGPADEAGSDTTASPRSGLGNGAGEVHPAAARRVTPIRPDPPKNLNSYRISEADRLGEGGPKQKFQRNLAAIQTLRRTEAES